MIRVTKLKGKFHTMYPEEDENMPELLDQGLLEYLDHPAYESFFREFNNAKYKYPQRAAIRACIALDRFIKENGEGGGIPWDMIPEEYICLAFDGVTRPNDEHMGHFPAYVSTVPLKNYYEVGGGTADWIPVRDLEEKPVWDSLRDVIEVSEPELFDLFPQWYLELSPSQSLVFRPGCVIPIKSDDSKKE